MKKTIIMLCGLLLVSGVYAAGSQMNFGLNFGIMTSDQLQVRSDHVDRGSGTGFSIERFHYAQPRGDAGRLPIQIQAIRPLSRHYLNFTPGSAFVGGGLTKGFLIPSDVAASDKVALKLNAGLISRNTTSPST